MSSLAMFHLALEGESLIEAIVVFLGLLAYAVPRFLRWLKERFGLNIPGLEEEARDEPALPGRRPHKRRAPGGGTFVGEDGERAPREGRTGAEIFRDLMRGEDERPRPGSAPVARRPEPSRSKPAARPQPTQPQPPTEPATLSDFGHSIEDLHERLDGERAEAARASLPSAAGDSLSSLSGLPSEDALEGLGGDSVFAPRVATPSVPTGDAASRRPGTRARSGWRAAVVASELLAPPLALRDPDRHAGALPR